VVGKFLLQWKQQSDSKCPFCQLQNKDAIHVILCQHTDMVLAWNQSWNSVEEWMLNNDGHSNLELIISMSKSLKGRVTVLLTLLPSGYTSTLSMPRSDRAGVETIHHWFYFPHLVQNSISKPETYRTRTLWSSMDVNFDGKNLESSTSSV